MIAHVARYLQTFLFVAFRAIPLDNGIAKIQQKDTPSVKADPAHLHLQIGQCIRSFVRSS